MFNLKTFPEYRQLDQTDCGPTCLKIIAAHYGKYLDLNYLRKISNQKSGGTTFSNLIDAGKKIGLELVGVRATLRQLINDVSFPVILHWNQNHYVVLYKISKQKIKISDPELGLVEFSFDEFSKKFPSTNDILLLLVEPINTFIHNPEETKFNKTDFLLKRLKPYRYLYVRLGVSLLILLIIQITLPFLTQSLVDYGINFNDLSFIYLVAIAQIFLIIVMLLSKIIREHILLKVSIGFTKNLLNSFIDKILYLPLHFIESKNIGDFVQRVNDHDRIQNFLNDNVFGLFFDILSILVFMSILAYFDMNIFLVLISSVFLLFGWSYLFLRKQANLDHELFKIDSNKQSQIVQLINNASEIKLNGSYERRKFDWRKIQISIYNTELKVLKTDQLQYQGGLFIKDLSGIIIVLISAQGVIDGKISFGTMLAIQFMVGSLSLPISKLLGFINEFQKTSLSLNRVLDLMSGNHKIKNYEYAKSIQPTSIEINNLSFFYNPEEKQILKNIQLTIPKNKITALVGESGSGKSTLIKVLLKLYMPSSGSITVSNDNLNNIQSEAWQKMCGAVIQGGKLFNDTIERNITESKSTEVVNYELLNKVINLSNLEELIEDLPLGLQTKVGENASFLSGGEKQRLMIARALYKKPLYLFLDEATSALDSRNERIITNNILKFSNKCTIIISAHRLSTIKLADQIIVLEKGEIIEKGNHEVLTSKKGAYYQLLKNQL
jgi:ATP-binding cassette subfamily B protein